MFDNLIKILQFHNVQFLRPLTHLALFAVVEEAASTRERLLERQVDALAVRPTARVVIAPVQHCIKSNNNLISNHRQQQEKTIIIFLR